MKTVIEMAREAGLCDEEGRDDNSVIIENHLKRFAALARAAEREALEKLDWTAIMREGGLVTWGDADELGDRVVAAIRARGNT